MKKKSIPKNKYLLVRPGVYPFDFLLCIGADHKNLIKYIETKLNYQLDEDEKSCLVLNNANGRMVRLKNKQHVIILQSQKTKIGFELNIFIHELSHYIISVFDICGIKINMDNDEVFAHFIGYLTKKVISNFDK